MAMINMKIYLNVPKIFAVEFTGNYKKKIAWIDFNLPIGCS